MEILVSPVAIDPRACDELGCEVYCGMDNSCFMCECNIFNCNIDIG